MEFRYGLMQHKTVQIDKKHANQFRHGVWEKEHCSRKFQFSALWKCQVVLSVGFQDPLKNTMQNKTLQAESEFVSPGRRMPLNPKCNIIQAGTFRHGHPPLGSKSRVSEPAPTPTQNLARRA